MGVAEVVDADVEVGSGRLYGGTNRNIVERAFNQVMIWRGLANRYDKHALVVR